MVKRVTLWGGTWTPFLHQAYPALSTSVSVYSPSSLPT